MEREKGVKKASKPGYKQGGKFNDEVEKKFEAASEILKKVGIKALQEELEQIHINLSNPRFTVAVVGEFSRGKSTLVNRLIGLDVLPTDVKPTTAFITRIIDREKEMMVFVKKNGKKRGMPLKPDSWNGLTADNDIKTDGVVFVGVNNPWLRKDYIEIIDTPGTNDLVSERALITDKALINADASIITISAISPFSMTERMFIKERILYHNVPKVILCVTMLDEIKEETDRIKLLNRIRETATKTGLNDIKIFVPQETLLTNPETIGVECGIEAIREQISSWTNESDMNLLKSTQINFNICEVLEKALVAVTDQQKILIDSENKKIDTVIADKKQQIENSVAKWDEFSQKFNEKCELSVKEVNKLMEQKEKIIVEQICHELSKTNNPKQWIENDYPYSIKMKIIPLSQNIEVTVVRSLNQDINWLQNSIKSSFGGATMLQNDNAFDFSLDELSVESSSQGVVADIEKSRNVSRVLVGAAQITGFTLISLLSGGTVAPILGSVGGSTVCTLLTQKSLNKKLNNQKEELYPCVADDIHRLIANGMEKIIKQIHIAYNKILVQSKSSCEDWKRAMLESLSQMQNQNKNANIQKFDSLSEEIQALIKSLK